MARNIENNVLFGQVTLTGRDIDKISDTLKTLWDDFFAPPSEEEAKADMYYSNNPFDIANAQTKAYSQIHSLGVIMREGVEQHDFDNKM